jgi:hypothetical protein
MPEWTGRGQPVHVQRLRVLHHHVALRIYDVMYIVLTSSLRGGHDL